MCVCLLSHKKIYRLELRYCFQFDRLTIYIYIYVDGLGIRDVHAKIGNLKLRVCDTKVGKDFVDTFVYISSIFIDKVFVSLTLWVFL